VTANVVHISSILEMQQRHFVEDEMQWRAEVERLRRQNEALSRENERGKLQAGDLVRAISSLRE
jgi:hypothetical protein